ncbi:MAG TPA: ribosome biogenesis GTP-binding protein YihA/YsxC [Candidatus Sabulitectum sp.]|nr:ribosome biogenesis GTP-binding protein YihA/YsxC [Candidatus Sabulitectum sp.]HPF31494.1 ribosome biogenesis GTP-binding protein YihA/YsxC [Candidatus Sabulitectum sp.]HPJ29290.1 ribosome biogenesis GTP-binding protein YihA/YsxC [Candidatus Sabulitectum sp.]
MAKLTIEFLKSCPGREGLPTDGLPEVAFIGRSNVGKSSLINRLAGGRKVARTSSRPGCTQFINIFTTNRDFYIADLPGYGFAKAPERLRSQWIDWIGWYLRERKPLRGTVLLVDARHPDLENDRSMAEYLMEGGKPYIVALTKSDKLKRGKLAASVRQAGEMGPVIPVSSMDGSGMNELCRWLADTTAAGMPVGS